MGKHTAPRSEEHKQKIAEALKRSWTPERRAAYSATSRGKNNPFFGKHHTAEANTKRAMPGEQNPFYGKHHTKHTREIISEAKRGFSPMLRKRYGISDKEYAKKIT